MNSMIKKFLGLKSNVFNELYLYFSKVFPATSKKTKSSNQNVRITHKSDCFNWMTWVTPSSAMTYIFNQTRKSNECITLRNNFPTDYDYLLELHLKQPSTNAFCIMKTPRWSQYIGLDFVVKEMHQILMDYTTFSNLISWPCVSSLSDKIFQQLELHKLHITSTNQLQILSDHHWNSLFHWNIFMKLK